MVCKAWRGERSSAMGGWGV